ncbi:MAG TPA: NUDIX hydrolase [Chloroflexia bacterium]|jgi:mutator protein MutT
MMLLVDPSGRVLLQLRTADAPTSSNYWALPGGSLEAGETPEEAVRREVREEAGIAVIGQLELFRHLAAYSHDGSTWTVAGSLEGAIATRPAAIWEGYIFCAATDARQEEVVLGEGEAMVFQVPQAALQLDLGPLARLILPEFFASPQYSGLFRS